MANLEVEYLGLKLKNPIIVSSSSLTSSVEKVLQLEHAGAGAVVLKSIFEEQINNQSSYIDSFNEGQSEAADYINYYIKENNLNDYVKLVSSCKKQCTIPIIASINCTKSGQWVSFAKEIEAAGADALELNIFILATSKADSAERIEKEYLETAQQVSSSIKIPVSVKIGRTFTSLPNIASELYNRGVKGVVMYNRFHEHDIDIEKQTLKDADIFSLRAEVRSHIRDMAIVSSAVPTINYAASTGVKNGEDIIKMMLAGATAVQICSVVYQESDKVIGQMVDFISSYMSRHEIASTKEFIGKLSYAKDAMQYERSQFMKQFSSYKG